MPKTVSRSRRNTVEATAILAAYRPDPAAREKQLLTLQFALDDDIAESLRTYLDIEVFEVLRLLLDFWPERVPLQSL